MRDVVRNNAKAKLRLTPAPAFLVIPVALALAGQGGPIVRLTASR